MATSASSRSNSRALAFGLALLASSVGLVHCIGDAPIRGSGATDGGGSTVDAVAPVDGAASCAAGETSCGTTCTNTQTDSANCGKCGAACGAGQTCSNGTCAGGTTCTGGLTACSLADGGPGCVDTARDDANCGGCGKACGATKACVGGQCKDTPPSCAGVLAATATAADGRYTIQPATGPAAGKRFEVYCDGMASGSPPKEYLELQPQATPSNFARYSPSSCATCSTAYERRFTKIRLDPATLVVDVADFKFATAPGAQQPTQDCWEKSTGACLNALTIGYGRAENCDGTPAGTANVDLRGTPFSVASTVTWTPTGNNPKGATTFTNGRKTVEITGGGACGWNIPSSPFQLAID